jgi:hypothetical protein
MFYSGRPIRKGYLVLNWETPGPDLQVARSTEQEKRRGMVLAALLPISSVGTSLRT